MAKIICIVGNMASGKDHILKEVVKIGNVVPIISTTSRPMRCGEQQDREYHFITHDKAVTLIKQNKFIEKRIYRVASGEDWIYGILKKDIDLKSNNIYICIVDYNGLCELQRYVDDKQNQTTIISIFINCSKEERLRRAYTRQQNELTEEVVNEIQRRIEADDKGLEPYKNECCVILRNQETKDLDNCIEFINQLALVIK